MMTIRNSFGILFALFLTFSSSLAFAVEALKRVPNKRVCMVTNTVFPNDQIPVAVAGKTYYGCCEGCKKTLSEDAASRVALDPMTQKSVDKASAYIAARPDGTVLYFENVASFKSYQKKK